MNNKNWQLQEGDQFAPAAWIEPLYVVPPAPANALAIVQGAMEAALQCCPGVSYCDPQQIADAIRAIDRQLVIDSMEGK